MIQYCYSDTILPWKFSPYTKNCRLQRQSANIDTYGCFQGCHSKGPCLYYVVSIQNLMTLDIVFGCLTKTRSPMSLSSAQALHILLSHKMKSLLLILAVLTLDLKFAFGNVRYMIYGSLYKMFSYKSIWPKCQCICDNPEELNDHGFRPWSPFGLGQYNVNGYELRPELQPSGKFYMNIISN